MLNSVSTDSEAQLKPPERPLDSDCCGQGCVPCVFDLYEEEVKIWEEECRKVTKSESKEFGQADCCIQVQKSFKSGFVLPVSPWGNTGLEVGPLFVCCLHVHPQHFSGAQFV